ncbi:MAG: aminotransferase class I/II-fold pyridoxal phosphate-dependent enzyme [Cyclobacteriaceae bacterium]
MATYSHSLETLVIHAGEEYIQGAVCPPIFQSSTYMTDGGEGYHNSQYIRLNNTPNQVSLSKKIATLEQGETAVVVSSGMAAISSTLLSFLHNGSHVLAQSCLYGATQQLLVNEFPLLGIEADFIDPDSPETWDIKLKTNTKVIYVESIANPTLSIGNLEAIVAFAKQHQLISIIDNTFATPINFNPLTLGFDLVIHSCSKYLNGHLDIVAGCVVGNNTMIKQITQRLNHMGSCLDPHVCFLLSRGIETLVLRVKQQNNNAMQIARFLESNPLVNKVIYPGLESHPQHLYAQKLFRGYGGVLSFKLEGEVSQTETFLRNLQIPLVAPSLGGVKTLITRPALTSHSEMTALDRQKIGISDKLIRLSVGIESSDDLISDLKNSLNLLC